MGNLADVKRQIAEFNQQLKLTYTNKKEELNYLYESQAKELQRAATLDQSQRDVEMIVQRHMMDVEDWMVSADKQINTFRKNQFMAFWQKLFTNSFVQSIEDSEKSEETENDEKDLIKFKTQLGVINKLKVTILLAQGLKDDELLEINQFRKVKKIPDKMPCNLIISTFDDSDKRLDKFL